MYDSDLEWLDGPGFLTWAREHRVPVEEFEGRNDSLGQALREARRGGGITLWKADELMVLCARHPREIPAELYRGKKAESRNPFGRAGMDHKLRAKILQEAADEADGDVGLRYGVSVRTIRRWRAEAGGREAVSA